MFLKNDELSEEVEKRASLVDFLKANLSGAILIWQAVIECLLYVRSCMKGFLSATCLALTQQPSDVSDAPFSPLGSPPYISCSNKL